jgi:aldehyde dehydrogenase (NAD+)
VLQVGLPTREFVDNAARAAAVWQEEIGNSLVSNDMTIAREEIFGPLLSIIPFDSEEEAVEIANDTEYGLSGSVWAGTQEHAIEIAQKLRTGQVDVNGGAFNPLAPFGGYEKSGIGR